MIGLLYHMYWASVLIATFLGVYKHFGSKYLSSLWTIYFYPLIVDLVCTNVLCTLCTVHTTSLSLILFCLSFATFFHIEFIFTLTVSFFWLCTLSFFSSQCSFLSRCPYFPRYSLIAYTMCVAHAGGILIKGTVQRATTGPGSDINL